MPSTVKVRVKCARNLPPPESRSQTSATTLHILQGPSRDPYVLVSLGGHAASIAASEEEEMLRKTISSTNNKSSSNSSVGYAVKTKICRRTTSPVWDEEFRFDVSDDTILQDEPLIFKVCDADHANFASSSAPSGGSSSTTTTTRDEAIGLVYIDLNPLLTTESDRGDDNKKDSEQVGGIDGWFPLYDCTTGVRGELLISVKLNFIGDVNPFRDSSAGVRLLPFSTIDPASDWAVTHICGFVEELLVADDPEFIEWNESYCFRHNTRDNRVSHETRQTLMYLLDASVRRRMCKTVLDMGGNAVLGYYQNFDVEGDSGIVARTYGTCVLMERNKRQQTVLLPLSSAMMTNGNNNSSTSLSFARGNSSFPRSGGGGLVGVGPGGDKSSTQTGGGSGALNGGTSNSKNQERLEELDRALDSSAPASDLLPPRSSRFWLSEASVSAATAARHHRVVENNHPDDEDL
jgi:hypothetical protein